MELIIKVFESLFKKQWIITLITFVEATLISIVIPNDFYQKLIFDEKINVIVGFCFIYIIVYLINYFIFWIINNYIKKYNEKQILLKNNEKIGSKIIDDWKNFFDEISDEDYSILMFFLKTNNLRVYKDWRDYKNITSDCVTIFSDENIKNIFYVTKTDEEGPVEEVVDFDSGKSIKVKVMGKAWNFKMKEEFYNFIKYIFEKDGKLSHFERKIYKLPYDNGKDLIEFQTEIPKKSGIPFSFRKSSVEEE